MCPKLPTIILAGLSAASVGSGPTTQPASQPTSRPSPGIASPGLRERSDVARLVADLGSPDFKTRESAHRHLAELGDSADAELIEYVTDSNEEIASRVVALLGKPKDPALRVELAVRLLSTADPDWMENGVYLLFDSPNEIYDLYMSRTKDAHGVERVIFDIVGDQLRTWKKLNDVFQRNYEKIKRKNPAAAERLLQSNRDSNLYDAEAAYWTAVEAVADYRDPDRKERHSTPGPTSRPVE